MALCLEQHKRGFMPTLDLELTARCTVASCIYCDSKPAVGEAHKDELDWPTFFRMLEQAKALGLEWIYTCGLGEPLEDDNFWKLLDFSQKNNINLSIFSNGLFIKDVSIARKLKNANVNIILKMDTFDAENFDTILGFPGCAKNIYKAMEYLLSAGYARSNDNYTDLAFSIVPTLLSYEGIPDVVAFCEKEKIFASIGELEQAGEVLKGTIQRDLSLNDEQVAHLKSIANKYADDGCYMRPVCPSILTGIHIDNIGKCIVDRITGLNCKWFLLTEPDIHTIGDIRTGTINELHNKVNAYREACFESNITQIDEYAKISYVFGGCGGNPKNIIELTRTALNANV